MRKVSNILLLVGGISAILCVVSFIVTAIMFFVAGGSPIIANILEPILKEQGIDDPDKITFAVQVCSLSMGFFFLIMGICGIPAAIVSFVAQKNPSKGLLIANIILGYFAGSYFSLAGGVVGLIANSREESKAKNSNVVDAQ